MNYLPTVPPPSVPFILMELGTLRVYTLQPMNWTPDDPITNWYWLDAASPQGYGPFQTLYSCIDHYKHVIYTTQNNKSLATGEAKPAPIIRVDFRHKTRVETKL